MEQDETYTTPQPDGTSSQNGITGTAAAPLPRRKNWFARHKKLLAVLAAAILVVVLVLRACTAAMPASTGSYQYIRTTTLQKTSLENSVTADGTVVSGSEASVTVADAAKLYTIATVEVEVGDEVQEGDVIATLDTTDLQKQIDSAELSYSDTLKSAQTTYDRAVDSYEVAVVQHDNRLIDLKENIADADENLADAQQALTDAKSARDSSQSTVDAAQNTVNSLQSAYTLAQGVSAYAASYDAAADALTAAATALDNAYQGYSSAYMAYTALAADATLESRSAALESLRAAASALGSAWAAYGSGTVDTVTNASVSSANRREVAAPTAADTAAVNAQLNAVNAALPGYGSQLGGSFTAIPTLSAPAGSLLVDGFNTAAANLVTQESSAASGTGMTYQQVIDSYTAAQAQLSAARTALAQAESQVTAAEAQVKTAESQVESAHDAYDTEKNSTTLTSLYQQIEDAETRLEQAKRTPDSLTTLQDTLADCTLTATMSGTVTALNATVGSTCAGTVATIQDTEGLTVEITLSADDVTQVETGMSCTISSDATGDAEIRGTLTQIDPVANEQGTFGAKVRVDTADSGLLIGIQAQVQIVQNVTENVFTVPIDAVGTAEDGSSFVYRKTGGEGVDMTFEQVPVTTGASNDYYIEISGDTLAEGDVIRATADLTEGIETADSQDSLAAMMSGGPSMSVSVTTPDGGPGGNMGGRGDGGGGGGAPDAPAGGQ